MRLSPTLRRSPYQSAKLSLEKGKSIYEPSFLIRTTVSPHQVRMSSTSPTRSYFLIIVSLENADQFQNHFASMMSMYPPASHKLLIVSNTAGTPTGDPSGADTRLLEESTQVPVLKHDTKKPGCGAEVMAYFRKHPESGVTHPGQVCIVGDRLFTDMMLANMMGSYGLWVRDGVKQDRGIVSSKSWYLVPNDRKD